MIPNIIVVVNPFLSMCLFIENWTMYDFSGHNESCTIYNCCIQIVMYGVTTQLACCIYTVKYVGMSKLLRSCRCMQSPGKQEITISITLGTVRQLSPQLSHVRPHPLPAMNYWTK